IGKVQTVLGPVDPEQLGRTMTHEHLTMSFECCYCPPAAGAEPEPENPFQMQHMHWLRQNPYSCQENLYLKQETGAVRDELLAYRKAGGGTIVENTTTGIDRDLPTLKQLAKDTGVHIIAGAGFYVDATHSEATRKMSVEKLTDVIVSEVLHGADGTDIRCGVIGEIGTSWPITDSENKVLRATAHAQAQLGCPVIIHPGRSPAAPAEILRILQEAGGDISKTVMSHLDSLAFLVKEGFEDRLVISHDIHTKNRLAKFGGHGYSHILRNIVPKMLTRGITQQQVDKILMDNPKHWLTFK
uniref:N-acetyltaurine hydrolase n=1 Tax=Oryzias latipes TaxID=8090 RepID=A0A3P9LW68_ORYLA